MVCEPVGARLLQDESLEAFDKEFRDWPQYQQLLAENFSSVSPRSILDVGGGNGAFLDRVLTFYPEASGVVLDNSTLMLEKNTVGPRKSVVIGSAVEVGRLFEPEQFDLVTVNVLLHHLVGKSEEQTRELITRCLEGIRSLIRPGGLVVVYEQIYEGLLPLPDPGRLIYALTSIRQPWIARHLKKFGANTAGIGVRFRSTGAWRSLFSQAGLLVLAERDVVIDDPPLTRRVALNIGKVGSYLFLLKPE